MQEDEQGFLYPTVDLNSCIDCNICEKICPMVHRDIPHRQPLDTFAYSAGSKETLLQSASGGAFSALALSILNQNGIVFGATFDQMWGAKHEYIEHASDLPRLRGSKYTQSVIGQSYKEAESFLKKNKKVLFSGTPCQIAGLHKYLGKNYSGLLFTVEIICHGVPSPKIWKEMLSHILPHHGANIKDLSDINMRDKEKGWIDYDVKLYYEKSDGANRGIISESHNKNAFMKGFINNLYIRPSCFNCPFKSGKSGADITIGDYWGVDRTNPKLYNKDGVSAVLARTVQGLTLCRDSGVDGNSTQYLDVLKGNPAIESCAEKNSLYNTFWENYSRNGIEAVEQTVKTIQPPKIISIIKKIKNYIVQFTQT